MVADRIRIPRHGQARRGQVTWCDGGKLPPKEVYDGPDKSGCIIVGSKGKMHGVGDDCGNVKMIGVDKPKVEWEKPPGHFKEYAEAIRGGKPA